MMLQNKRLRTLNQIEHFLKVSSRCHYSPSNHGPLNNLQCLQKVHFLFKIF